MRTELEKKSWKLYKRVLPQHTDHAGVMWHGAYLNWMEEARVAALDEAGFSYRELTKQGFDLPLVSLQIKYIKAITHGQLILLKSWSLPRKGLRFPWRTEFIGEDKSLMAKSVVELVFVNNAGSEPAIVRHIPEIISDSLLKLQEGPDGCKKKLIQD